MRKPLVACLVILSGAACGSSSSNSPGVPKDGSGTPTTMYASTRIPNGIAVDASGVCWTEDGTDTTEEVDSEEVERREGYLPLHEWVGGRVSREAHHRLRRRPPS